MRSRRRFAGATLLLALTLTTFPRTVLSQGIAHVAPDCVIVETFPKIDACFDAAVARANITFRAGRAGLGGPWYHVQLESDRDPLLNCFSGVLPRPMRSIKDGKLSYRIDVTWEDLAKTQSKVYEADVVEVVRACDGTVADHVTNASVPVSSASGDLSLPDGFDGVYAVEEPDEPERQQGPTNAPAITGPGQGAGAEGDSGGSDTALIITGIGAGAAAVPLLMSTATTCTQPSLPSSCLGIGRNSSSCNQILRDYDDFCQCSGFSGFDVRFGGCY